MTQSGSLKGILKVCQPVHRCKDQHTCASGKEQAPARGKGAVPYAVVALPYTSVGRRAPSLPSTIPYPQTTARSFTSRNYLSSTVRLYILGGADSTLASG